MLELYIDQRGELAIENLEDLLEEFPLYAERGIESAFRSEGYRLLQILRRAVQRGGASGEWPKLHPSTGVLSRAREGLDGRRKSVRNYRMVWRGPKGRKRRGREYKRVMASKRTEPLSRFRGALRYDYDQNLRMISIGFRKEIPGWKLKKMRALLHRQAEGYRTDITPKMRKFLFALGFPVGASTAYLETPARPLIEPVFEREREKIVKNIDMKFARNVLRYMTERGKSR